MLGGMKFINTDALIKGFHDIKCGEAEIILIDKKDFEIPQNTTHPLPGFEFPENFPNCCPAHKKILKIANEKFNKFPNCCNNHKKLNTALWFKKSNYSYYPLKVVQTLAYTWYCISKCIDNTNWYKEITDYIDLTALSYGQLPDGYGPPVGIELYLYNLEKNIENENDMPEIKKAKLISFIRDWGKPVSEIEEIDLNLLIKTYKTWLNDFPFELSFFTHLKPQFENQIPILAGKGNTNIYTGITAHKVVSYSGLIDILVSSTEKIISEVNTLVLYEKGLISDVQKANIDIINASHRFNLKSIKDNQPKGRKQYSKIIANWFKYEKEYLNDLTSALTKVLPVQNKAEGKKKKDNIQSPVISLFCYLANNSDLITKEINETVLSYCKRVCSKYNLPFKDRVRQGFSTSYNKINIRKVKELILPNIDEIDKELIISYLDNNQLQKQKLYA
mgnify:CR=1 FL=1